MKLTLILAAFSSILTCIVQAICTPGGITDVSLNFVNKVIFGTKKGGFSLTCQYSFTGAYNLYLWRIDKYNGISFDTIYTHIPGLNPPVSQAGPNYSSRNLTLQNMDTVVFPDMMISDVGNDTYRCTVQFNLSAVSCEESPVLKTNIAADTVTDIGDFKSGSLPVESTVQVKVTGTDYLPYDMAVTRFLVNIDGNNKTLNIITTDQADGLEAFTSNVSLQTPATHEKNINFAVYMVVDDSSIIVAEKIFRTEPTCDCLPCLIIAAILAGLVIIFILLLCCYGSNRAADSENAGGKCFRCRKDNHRAKTCKAPDNGSEYRKNREKTLPDLDDKTIEMNLKKDLEAMKQSETDVKQKYVIDMKLGTITVNNKEYAQFIITKKQSQVEICLYWKEERMEWHQLIYKTNQSNRAAVEGCCSDPWRLALFIGSIGLIITSLGCLIYPLAGCLPLEGQCVGSVVVSGLGIPLGIVGLLLCFCWRIDGYSWLCSCCNRGNKNSDTEMTGQSTPLSNSSNRDLRL